MAIEGFNTIDSTVFKDIIANYKEALETCIENYTKLFCLKHGFNYESDMWVSGEIGSIICISDMFINFSDIRLDLEKNVTKGIFSEWYWTVVDKRPYINYNSWVMGLRHSNLKQNENGTTN